MGKRNIKIILLEPVLAHYRKDVFDLLTRHQGYNLELVAGINYQNIKSITTFRQKLFQHWSFSLFQHKFYFLRGSVFYILRQNPDILISTGLDFHLIHTWILFFIYRIILRKKFVWWSHATKGNQGRIGYLSRRFFYKSANGVLSYNAEGKDRLIKMSLDENKIKVVNNSINYEDYGFLNYDLHRYKKEKVFTILYSGRITPAKKVDYLIKALDYLNTKNRFEFRCIILGDGDLKSISDLVEQLNLKDNVEFVGAKYGIEAHKYFLDADIFVYPGGIGLSIVHAMSFGLPVITTDDKSSHFPEFELLVKGVNGDTFIDGSYVDLANKIFEWESKLRVNSNLYSDNCIRIIKEKGYLPEIMYENVNDFMDKLIGNA